ncbi:hypothetical protein J0S82_011298 [Galemys pyrenaicus]|uniref:Uncharacterized protein n=1 Tax=Galemys pyrenaicus TaxID=202257 RepID=A0A8J6DMY8_GALPY|nr:hypothetical protein J0S82_011298 [Galemys pyrenaicus]
MLNPYGDASGGDRVDDSRIASRGCGEAAALLRAGSPEIGPGHILRCSGFIDENEPPGVLWPHPGSLGSYAPAALHFSWSGQWRSYEWHDLPEPGGRQSYWAWMPGKTLLEGEAGRGCCTPGTLPLSLKSPNHRAANWLGDVAGYCFPMGLCGTLLPGDQRFGNGGCDVIASADQ